MNSLDYINNLFPVNLVLLDGKILCNETLFYLDILVILHFIIFVLVKNIVQKRFVDFTNFTLFIYYILPMFIMYPFNGSFYNYISLNDNTYKSLAYLSSAFLICFIGYISIWIGKFWFQIVKEDSVFKIFTFPYNSYISFCFKKIINSKFIMNLIFFITIFFLLALNLFLYQEGYFFKGRSYFMIHNELNFIFNAICSIIYFAIYFLGFRYIYKQDKYTLNLFIITLFLVLTIGFRSIVVFPLAYIGVFYIMIRKAGRISLLSIFLIGIILISIIFGIGHLRGDTAQNSSIQNQILYGNTFSDERDFALILSCWNDQYLNGKTYLAGILAFIPSSKSEFRYMWNFGKYTTWITGYSGGIHNGFRVGNFGEPFLNFGIFGVILFGIIGGYIYSYIDYKVIKYTRKKQYLNASTVFLAIFLVQYLYSSIGLFIFYLFIMMVIFYYIIYKILVKS